MKKKPILQCIIQSRKASCVGVPFFTMHLIIEIKSGAGTVSKALQKKHEAFGHSLEITETHRIARSEPLETSDKLILQNLE